MTTHTLTRNQQIVLDFVVRNGPVQAKEISESTPVKNTGDALRTLRDNGFVQRIAASPTAKRNVFWRANNEVVLAQDSEPEPEPEPVAGIDFPLFSLEVWSDGCRFNHRDAARLIAAVGNFEVSS